MKIEIEKLLLLIYLIVLIISVIYFVTPSPDSYYYYTISKYISRDPSILWRTNLTGNALFLSNSGTNFFTVPPLALIIYAVLFFFSLPQNILDILSIVAIGYMLWKTNKKAIPFLFLSFLFIRSAAFGGLDIFLVALALASFYFFEKKPLLSGFFAGLCPLAKGTGFLVLGSYLIAVLVLKRREIFKRDFYKNKFFIAMIISILVLSPWYLRNYVLFNGNMIGTLIGASPEVVASGEQFLMTGFQQTQPERYLWDSSGYYPLPIDILFYVGLFFTALGIYKSRKIELEHVFIIIFSATYFAMQAFDIRFLMTIRHYLPVFPLLAIVTSKGIPERYLKYAYIICLAFLIFFIFSLPKYAFNQYSAMVEPVCKQIKSAIDFEPVFVNAFQGWFVTFKCDLNATAQNVSKWTLDFDKGQLYPTNNTNSTSG